MSSAIKKASDAPVSPSFTQPFGFASLVRRPGSGLDLVPVLDLLVTALFVGLLFTRFVMTPGVRVDLPVTDMRMSHSYSEVAVMTISESGIFFFDGRVYDAGSVRPALEAFVSASETEDLALLMKIEGSMDVQGLMELCQAAQAAGFRQVQIAGRKPGSAPANFSGGMEGGPSAPASNSLFSSP
jgi:biopolymer transport protein ExbD